MTQHVMSTVLVDFIGGRGAGAPAATALVYIELSCAPLMVLGSYLLFFESSSLLFDALASWCS